MNYVYVVLYLVAVVIANLTVAKFGPSVVLINAFFLISLDLTSRDKLHDAWEGKNLWLKMGALIATGSLISYALNKNAGSIALASFVAFAAANTVDALLYAALHSRPWWQRANGSNVASAAVDSVVFPWLAFGSPVWYIVLGQFAFKVLGGFVWSVVLSRRKSGQAQSLQLEA